jgi:hypothetical protein
MREFLLHGAVPDLIEQMQERATHPINAHIIRIECQVIELLGQQIDDVVSHWDMNHLFRYHVEERTKTDMLQIQRILRVQMSQMLQSTDQCIAAPEVFVLAQMAQQVLMAMREIVEAVRRLSDDPLPMTDRLLHAKMQIKMS